MNCYICKSKNVKILYKLKGYNVYKCGNCGLRFSWLSRKHSYEEEYFTKEQKQYFETEEGKESKIGIFKAWLGEIEKHIKSQKPQNSLNFDGYQSHKTLKSEISDDVKIQKNFEHCQNFQFWSCQKSKRFLKPGENKKILDVGCATGGFLGIAKKRGWNCYGIDVSKYAVEQARRKFKVNVKAAELDKARFKKDFFDVVFMSFIIEHTSNPVEIVQEAKKILKKDGILFISTINEDSLLNLAADLTYKFSFGLVKKPVELLHAHQHLTHFSEKDLKRILKESGFEILKFKKMDLPSENFQGGFFKDCVLGFFYFFQKLLNKEYIVYSLARKTS